MRNKPPDALMESISPIEVIEGFPVNVRAVLSTRGLQSPFNLGMHVGDEPSRVQANRLCFERALQAKGLWLRQVHGRLVQRLTPGHGLANDVVEADASVARDAGQGCVVMMADCLSVLACRTGADGRAVAVGAAHAGWRGLAAGVVEAMLSSLWAEHPTGPGQGLQVWLGPCIGPDAFEVGPEVRAVFQDELGAAAVSPLFRPSTLSPRSERRWMADLSGLARLRILRWSEQQAIPIMTLVQDQRCTVTASRWFYSHRRDPSSGRMAAGIALQG